MRLTVSLIGIRVAMFVVWLWHIPTFFIAMSAPETLKKGSVVMLPSQNPSGTSRTLLAINGRITSVLSILVCDCFPLTLLALPLFVELVPQESLDKLGKGHKLWLCCHCVRVEKQHYCRYHLHVSHIYRPLEECRDWGLDAGKLVPYFYQLFFFFLWVWPK